MAPARHTKDHTSERNGSYINKDFFSAKRIVLALQMQVAEGGAPQKTASCHFPKSLWITFPLLSVMVPSTSFTLEFQYLACKGHWGTKKGVAEKHSQESVHRDHDGDLLPVSGSCWAEEF